MKKNLFIVPHTHWDREWYLPYQRFRIHLVDSINRLFEMFKDRRFKSFTLDGQSIVLEDYLEIMPDKRKEIEKLVKAKRLQIGPFYVLPDEFLVSGEALVRNLLVGSKLAGTFGHAAKIGYLPDSFGHISQLPQILRGFDIDNFIFYRGRADEGKTPKSEFWWQAPDGSKVLAVHLIQEYGNGYFLITGNGKEYALRETVKSLNEQSKYATTKNFILCCGSDHLFPSDEFCEVVDYVKKNLKDYKIKWGSHLDYINAVQRCRPKLSVFRGELSGGRYALILRGVQSTRMYLKQANTRCQTLLEKYAEAASVLAWQLADRPYPDRLIERSWKYLLQNHAHDSICGCSADEVHEEMMTRFAASGQISEALTDNALTLLSDEIRTDCGYGEVPLIVFNPLNWRRTGIVDALIKVPYAIKDGKYEVKDCSGKVSPAIVENKKTMRIDNEKFVFGIDAERLSAIESKPYHEDYKEEKPLSVLRVFFLAEDVPSCGYKTFYLFPAKSSEIQTSPCSTGSKTTMKSAIARKVVTWQSQFYKIVINRNGSLDIRDKRTGAVYHQVNLFEDTEDGGDEYDYSSVKNSMTYTTSKETADVEIAEENLVFMRCRIYIPWRIPESLSDNYKERSRRLVICPITTELTVYNSIPRIDFKITVENNAKDHRMRALFPTPVKSESCYADGQFYVIKRCLKLAGSRNWVQKPGSTQPQQAFVDVTDGMKGLGVINKGLPEYEVIKDSRGYLTVALTLFRGVGWLSRLDLLTRSSGAGPDIPASAAQCLGRHLFEYSILPHKGNWVKGKIAQMAQEFNAPLNVHATGVHHGRLPDELSFIEVESNDVMVSAVKKAERRDTVIIRLYNLSGEKVVETIRFFKPVQDIWKVSLAERGLKRLVPENRTVKVAFNAYEIVTVEAKFKGTVPGSKRSNDR